MSDWRPSGPVKPPAVRPCGTCPYRRDCPSGVWDPDEYAKLPAYDGPTWAQPTRVFLCHEFPTPTEHRVCAGWAGCHDGPRLLSLRIALLTQTLSDEDFQATAGYVSPVPLYTSGQEAADHGMAEIEQPGREARQAAAKLVLRRQRRR